MITNKEIVIIILDTFADWETAFIASALNFIKTDEDKNYTVKYASIDKKIKTSTGNLKVIPHMTIDEIDTNISGIILIGSYSWRNLDNNTSNKILDIVKDFKKKDKVIAAICDAAYYLAINSLLNNCKHTVNNFDEIKNNKNYTNHNNYIKTDTKSILDNKIITATGTAAIHFAKNIMKALEDIPEKDINFFYNMHTIGYEKALENYK